ncbi:hypothetical protein EE071_28375 [Klebsiella pneumoniae]|nr:hypothetical protein [Klebsiella pneumoniae]
MNSLTGIAFDWFADLPNGSVTYFTELEALFLKRFAGAQHHVTVGDLVMAKQSEGEQLVDYILRWRNLSMKCEPQLQEQHAVEILLKNIHGPVAFLLKGFTIKTFEKLLIKASNLQGESSHIQAFQDRADRKFIKQNNQRPEKKIAHVSTVDKGKKPIQTQSINPVGPRPKQVDIPLKHASYTTTFEQKMNKEYSFKREAVKKMFKNISKKSDFILPEAKYPEKPGDKENPNYCPYHRMISHTIEDCFSFKDWLERNYKKGLIVIPPEYLVGKTGSANTITGESSNNSISIDKWDVALSRSSKKILNKTFCSSQQGSKKSPVQLVRTGPKASTVSGGTPAASVHVTPSIDTKSEHVVRKSEQKVLTAKGRPVSLQPLTLLDYYFVPSRTKKENKMNKKSSSAYILSIFDDDDENKIEIENSISNNDFLNNFEIENINLNSELNSQVNELEEPSDSESLIPDLQGSPIMIEFSDSDESIKNAENFNEIPLEDTDPAVAEYPEEIKEVNLRSGKVLPSRANNSDKGK